MASDNGSNSAIVALFALMLLTMLGAFIAWQAGVFGRSHHGGKPASTHILGK